MPLQTVQQRVRGFICVTAHPAGCAREVERQVAAVRAAFPEKLAGPKRALVIGSSTGYGLSTRIALAWGSGADTLGVFFEKPPAGKRTATAGYYNTAAMQRLARAENLYAEGINGDAFSDEIKQETCDRLKADLGPVDLVVYSLASPRRTHPRTGESLQSSLKPIGASYTGKTIDLNSAQVTEATVEPATEQEIQDTVAVMGGEDWAFWIDKLAAEGLLAEGARTVAYSYIGPEVTWPIYRDGTIGRAKLDLERVARELDARLASELGGGAWVSVNKAVVTQASSAIPVVPLYISLLFGVMKRRGVHEGCIEQMIRLVRDHVGAGSAPKVDERKLIRLDDLELAPEVQAEVAELWPRVTTENLDELSDYAGLKQDFNRLFGFDQDGVDYAAEVETDIPL